MKRELITIDEALELLKKSWLGKREYSRGHIYNLIHNKTFTNYGSGRFALLDKKAVLNELGLKSA